MITQRSQLRRPRALYWLLSLCLILTGCVSTKLEPTIESTSLQRLEALERRPLSIEVPQEALEQLTTVLGHQYILFAIPFGEITLVDPAAHVQHALKTALLETEARKRTSGSIVSVSRVSARITAYDFFITRRVVCSVTITLTSGATATTTETLWHPMPRETILGRLFSKTMLLAARKLFTVFPS